jgi:hypothetical protein
MKTAMQDMIEWIEQRFNNPQETEVFKKATELIEKEKEQIQNVFEHCWNHPNWKGEYEIKDMEDYLKNYNQNK